MTRRTRTNGSLVVAWALAAAAYAETPATQPAPAEANTPPTAPAARPPLLDFDSLSFELGVEGTYDRHKVRSHGYRQSYRQTDRAWSLEETLGLRGSGALVDEKIATFDFDIDGGFSQQWFRESRRGPDLRENPHGDLLQYDLSLMLLPRGKVSARAFATRLDSRVPRAFQPSLDRTLERYGAEVFINDRTLPMRFSFEHVWDEMTSRTERLLDSEERGHDAFNYEGTWQISERHSLRLQYEFEDRREQYSGGRTHYDTTRNYVVLDHTLRFGNEGRSALETQARFQDESGALARDIAELSSQLRLQHTDALSSNYRVQFLRESFQELTTRTARGELGLAHQLGETLTSSVQLYGLRQSASDNADFTEWGGVATTAFSRDNALGRFSANLSYNHAVTSTDSGGRRGLVIGETITLRDPLPAFLAHRDVDLLTVVVTDTSGGRLFLPIRDYVVVPLRRYTAIYRVPTGRIADGQAVFVSYTYRVYSNYDLGRDRIDFRAQQDFKFGLTPYYAASFQNEHIDDSRFVRFAARNVNRHRVGATFRQKRWSVGLEYEYNDDSIDPYQAVHLNGDVVMWQSASAQLDGQGTLSRFWFDGTNELVSRNTTLLDLGLSYRYLLAQNLEGSASAMYRYEDDSFQGITHAVDLQAALEWKLGYFALRLEAEYDTLHLPRSADDGFAVWLKLKREIPVVTGRRS